MISTTRKKGRAKPAKSRAPSPESEPTPRRGRPRKTADPDMEAEIARIKAEVAAAAKAKYKAKYAQRGAGKAALPPIKEEPQPAKEPKTAKQIREIAIVHKQPTLADHLYSGIVKDGGVIKEMMR